MTATLCIHQSSRNDRNLPDSKWNANDRFSTVGCVSQWHLVKQPVSTSILISSHFHSRSHREFSPLPALNWVFPPSESEQRIPGMPFFRIHPIWTTKRYCSQETEGGWLGCELEPICSHHRNATPSPFTPISSFIVRVRKLPWGLVKYS